MNESRGSVLDGRAACNLQCNPVKSSPGTLELIQRLEYLMGQHHEEKGRAAAFRTMICILQTLQVREVAAALSRSVGFFWFSHPIQLQVRIKYKLLNVF
jgi:hypothetical protein